jgi:ABC-type branched-subunit amino acid transport system substrate-binding protein
MKNYLRFVSLGLLVVMLATSLLGCGGGGGAGTIKIGAPMPITGPYASDGEQMQKALELAVEEQNAKGGVLGKKLELIPGDVGALEAEKIKAVGERLMGEKVDVAITGYADSGVDAKVFGEYDIPYLHADALSADTDLVAQNPDYRNVFQYCPSEVFYGIDTAANLFNVPAALKWTPPNKKIAIIKVDYSYNVMAADKFGALAKEAGYEVVVDELTQFGVVEWGPILSKIDEAQPAYVTFWNLDPTDAARFMIQFKEKFGDKGLNALVYMQYTPNIPEFYQLAGDAANGVLWTTDVAPVGKGVKEYTARWKAKFNEDPKSAYAYITRDAFDIWVAAVEKAGCSDCYEKVIENIRKTSHDGMGGLYEFTENDQQAKSGNEFLPTIWYQIQDGKNVIVGPEKLKEGGYTMPYWIK